MVVLFILCTWKTICYLPYPKKLWHASTIKKNFNLYFHILIELSPSLFYAWGHRRLFHMSPVSSPESIDSFRRFINSFNVLSDSKINQMRNFPESLINSIHKASFFFIGKGVNTSFCISLGHMTRCSETSSVDNGPPSWEMKNPYWSQSKTRKNPC